MKAGAAGERPDRAGSGNGRQAPAPTPSHMASLPLDANVLFMTVMATAARRGR